LLETGVLQVGQAEVVARGDINRAQIPEHERQLLQRQELSNPYSGFQECNGFFLRRW